MKKTLLSLVVLLSALVLAGCNNASQDAAIKQAVSQFVKAWAAGDTTALAKALPGLTLPDSFALPFDANTLTDEQIVVAPDSAAEQQFTVQLPGSLAMLVKQVGDTTFSVDKTFGFIAYPAEKLDFARKTGWIESGMSDKEIQERFADENFTKTIGDLAAARLREQVVIGPVAKSTRSLPNVGTEEETLNTFSVQNNMDKDLDGSDYNVVATITEDSFMSGPMGIQESPTTSKRQVLKGVNLPKGGSTKMSVKTHSIIHTQYGDVSTFKNARVEFTLSPEKLVEKYYTPTGDEYKAYLENKK